MNRRLVLGMMLCVSALAGEGFKTLVYFDGADGSGPNAPIVQGFDGNFYGTTATGGTHGCGTLFKIDATGILQAFYSFSGPDGCFPDGLLQAADGNLYGTTSEGGANACPIYDSGGCGTIFKLERGGKLTTLYNFCSQPNCTDGVEPFAGLVEAGGYFYGTTATGGGPNGAGTVFRITAGGALTTLHTFCTQANCPDGATPAVPLILARDGNFYGTTNTGGGTCPSTGPGGCGTIFKMSPDGTLTTLHSFNGGDGQYPNGLMQAANGELFGTTYVGGTPNCQSGCGTIFGITPSGTFTTIYSFNGVDGAGPLSGLIQTYDGRLYGTTSGGSFNAGTIFTLTAQGTLGDIIDFDGRNGQAPIAALVPATDGSLWGSTFYGGSSGSGTIFRMDVGLGYFLTSTPSYGKAGTRVRILGTGLRGATAVTFNGTPADFTVASATLIETSVPEGATTGKIEVTTGSGTLVSNVAFQVRP